METKMKSSSLIISTTIIQGKTKNLLTRYSSEDSGFFMFRWLFCFFSKEAVHIFVNGFIKAIVEISKMCLRASSAASQDKTATDRWCVKSKGSLKARRGTTHVSKDAETTRLCRRRTKHLDFFWSLLSSVWWEPKSYTETWRRFVWAAGVCGIKALRVRTQHIRKERKSQEVASVSW